MFPGGVIVLAEETGVRKVQSRRFLAGVVWKTRYCVLRRDHISTLSIYKNAAAITDVPMDIITINHAAKVVNAFDGGRRILHVISENGGGMVTKELAFDTADKESRWASEIQAIIEMSRAEHSEKSAALSTSLDIKDSGSDVLIDVQPAVAIDETALSTTRSSPNFEVMKTSYAEPAIHKQLAKGTHSDSEQLGVRAPPRPGPGLSSPSGTAIALPETPKISGLSKRLEIDNISKNQLDIITMKSGTKQTEAAPVMSSKPSKPQKQPAGVSSDHTSAPVMPAADQRAKSWKTMPSSALAAPVSTMDPNAAQLHVSFDRAIMAPTLSRPSRSLAGHTIANASNELDKGLSDERLQSVYVRSGGDIISATPRRRDASKTSTAETPFSLELGLEKKIHPGNLDRNVKWSASRGGTSLNSTGSVEASSASVRRDSPDDVITSPARHNFEAENRSLMTLNKQLSQRIAAERMNGIDESAALRAQLLLLTGECSDFKIRCAALEEQNRLLESERAALSEALNSCQQSLHLEQQISVSLASQNALDKTHLVRENDIKLISVQQSENHSAVQITMEESLSARIESLTSQLKIKDDDVSRYQKLVQDLKLEIGELREQHMVAVHTSAALEQRLSSELQQEMVNESKRLAFFERENSSLKATLIERQKDIEELMKEVDRMMCVTQKNEECAGVETIAVPNNRDVSTAGFDVSASKALSEVNEALNTKLFLAQSEISSAQAQVAFLRSELARVEGVMLSEREIKGRLEAETSALHDEARRGRARIEETEEELEKKYRLQSSEIAKLVYFSASLY